MRRILSLLNLAVTKATKLFSAKLFDIINNIAAQRSYGSSAAIIQQFTAFVLLLNTEVVCFSRLLS